MVWAPLLLTKRLEGLFWEASLHSLLKIPSMHVLCERARFQSCRKIYHSIDLGLQRLRRYSPQPLFLKGHGFIRAVKANKMCGL